jgi:hypothetical protein
MEMENFIQLSIHRSIPLRKDVTNNDSGHSFVSQSESMLGQDWVLMQDGALMQAKTGNKDWVPMKEKEEQTDRVPMMMEDGVPMQRHTGVLIESVPD